MTLGLNLLLLALWLWLYRAVFPYLAVIFTRQEFRTNQIVLLGALLLIALQVRKGAIRPRLGSQPQFYWPALGLALSSSVLYLLVERFLDINTFAATLFGLSSYGLLGLWMEPVKWRQGLPAALLLVGALPFGEHLQTFIGYPVRVLTAGLVRDGLRALGVPALGVDTILVFESGVSKVDLPCSGVKSLWTGGLFLLADTWIERRRINMRWLFVAVSFVVLLLVANYARVALLVATGYVAGWLLLAEMLHVPLGVLGFAGSCALGAVLLRYTGEPWRDPHLGELPASQANPVRPAWLAPALGAVIFLMGFLYTPRPQPATAHAIAGWQFPTELAAERWPLSPGEQDWLESIEAQSADRYRFSWGGLNGSLLLVGSQTWRAHHRPERCFEVYGLGPDESYTYLVGNDFPVRMLSLGNERHPGQLSAAYWLQSPTQVTDDYATRIWSDLAPQREPWVLVTILFDGPYDPRSADAQALYLLIRQVVQARLAGGLKP